MLLYRHMIKVEHLHKTFGDFTAVNDLSFSVNPGDVYGFLGQNGAGKSTTIRMLLSLIHPSSGIIEIAGKNLTDNRKEILSKVGAMIERPDLYKYLSALDNLKLFAKMSGLHLSKQALINQLERVGLADRADSKVKTFSQGMKQRLGLAIALVHDPELIILDEPTNGMDPQGIADIRELIVSLSKEAGKTVLVSSHLLSEIELMANRMIIIHKGKKMVEGEVSQLLNPEQTSVRLTTGNDLIAMKVLSASQWSVYMESQDAEGIGLTMNKKLIPELVRFLTASQIDILSLQHRHSLEDYFLKLTQNL